MGLTGRILIIDNYDSFTYNLVHLVESITGSAVEVVMNDDVLFMNEIAGLHLKNRFDLVILSPGPGNPHTDVGCVTEYIIGYYLSQPKATEYPVLFGVCMGFEAIGVRCGIPIIKTAPRHGLRWEIHVDHAADADTVFKHLPAVISQVRYHSLVLCPKSLELHEDLLVTSFAIDVDPSACKPLIKLVGPHPTPATPGWLEDLSLSRLAAGNDPTHAHTTKIPMSFRHRTLPMYGVQFHPESILSDYGRDILRNVCELSGVICGSRMTVTSPTKPITTPKIAQRCQLVGTVGRDFLSTNMVRLFSQLLYSTTVASVWLDSPIGTSGRWSFMAGGSQASTSGHSVFAQYGSQITLVDGNPIPVQTESGIETFLKDVEHWIQTKSENVVRTGQEWKDLPPIGVPSIFICLGYECCSPGRTPSDEPDSVIIVSDRVLAFDNDSGNVYGMCVGGDDDWLSAMEAGLHDIAGIVEERSEPPIGAPVLNFAVRDSKSCYMEKVSTCQLAIERGESYELCLTTSIHSEELPFDMTDSDVLAKTYALLREANPAPNSAFMHVPQLSTFILSASPERFLRVDGETGIAEVKPIKGTRPRGRTVSEDDATKLELSTCAKDLAENLMIVDLVRNDLSRVCSSVHCPLLMAVETYEPYHQLVSTVQGRLDMDSAGSPPLAEATVRLFPAGSMTGAPKIRSMQILEAIESGRRGLGYSGAIGYLSPTTKSLDLSVVIRTILIQKRPTARSMSVSIGCGGAVLALSDPLEEWREMILKARRNLAVFAASVGSPGIILRVGEGSPGMFIRAFRSNMSTSDVMTTMRYERDRGIWLFERHIDRLCTYVDGWSRDGIRTAVIDAIRASSQSVDHPAGGTPLPLSDGPFTGVTSMEWCMINVDMPDCRIRIDLHLPVDQPHPTVTCLLSPLPTSNLGTLSISPVRVDSCDQTLRIKSPDWFVPGLGAHRDSALLVNEMDHITETGIANVAVRIGNRWITPPCERTCLLPGTVRNLLLECGSLMEGTIPLDTLGNSELICFNSVRGIWRACLYRNS